MIKSPGYTTFVDSNSYPEGIIVSELGWKLAEHLVDQDLAGNWSSKRLVLFSPYVNWPAWELVEIFKGKTYLNKTAIDNVMAVDCPPVIKNALMAYVMQGMI